MKSIRVLLVDTTNAHKELLDRRLANPDSARFIVSFAEVKTASALFLDNPDQFDIVIFGDKVSPNIVAQTTRAIRARNLILPIFVLTRQSEARMPKNFKGAGVDDMVNVAEIDSPLFSWTFMSVVEQAVLKKKAREYDGMYRRLRTISDSLGALIHEINNPLSVIRLAMYHLENPELSRAKRETFFKLLMDNLEKVDSRMKELHVIRRQMGGESVPHAKILSIRPTPEVLTGR